MTSLRSLLEEMTLLLLPHGGQRTARRNAWRAAYDSRQSMIRRADPGAALTAVVPADDARTVAVVASH
jgi:hypothetical protein